MSDYHVINSSLVWLAPTKVGGSITISTGLLSMMGEIQSPWGWILTTTDGPRFIEGQGRFMALIFSERRKGETTCEGGLVLTEWGEYPSFRRWGKTPEEAFSAAFSLWKTARAIGFAEFEVDTHQTAEPRR